jgi:nucleoside-diphosphate kinase
MSIEATFAMIKPDAVAAGNTGKIIDMVEHAGFAILRMHKVRITKEGAELLYEIHKEKPFFNEMVDFIVSGPIIIMVLEKENAIQDWRNLMGATNPKDAKEGSVRKLFGADIGHNAVHGSDSVESAYKELSLFFPDMFEGLQQEQAQQ